MSTNSHLASALCNRMPGWHQKCLPSPSALSLTVTNFFPFLQAHKMRHAFWLSGTTRWSPTAVDKNADFLPHKRVFQLGFRSYRQVITLNPDFKFGLHKKIDLLFLTLPKNNTKYIPNLRESYKPYFLNSLVFPK